MSARPGAVSVAELLLVAWLFAMALAGVARFAAGQNQLAALQRDRLRFEEAVRTAVVVLGAELRYLAPEDVSAAATDSLRIRAFRGGGHLCGVEADRLRVAYAGIRRPDPSRDSVLVLGPDTAWVHALVSVAGSTGCAGGVEVQLDRPAGPGAGYALVFETGVYTLDAGAVRYRRGLGGRQPLTETVLRDMAFETAAAGFSLRLAPDADSLVRLRPQPRQLGIAGLNRAMEP